MKFRDALRALAEVTGSQWGLITSAQAAARGVDRLVLSRLAQAGDLKRLTHGVYKDRGAPGDAHLELRAAWLATAPAEFADERLKMRPSDATVSGESAARLHGVGDLRAAQNEFTVPARKQTQRPDVRYRTRALSSADVTIREGLPVTTLERTLADLVETRTDLSLVAGALADAARTGGVDADRLSNMLAPLAYRNGHSKGDGDALLQRLLEIAGLDRDAIAKRIASLSGIGALVAADFLKALPSPAIAQMIGTAAAQSILQPVSAELKQALAAKFAPTMKLFNESLVDDWARGFQLSIAEQLKAFDWTGLAATAAALDRREQAGDEVGL